MKTPYALRSEEQKEMARAAQRRYRAAHPDKVAAQNDRSVARRKEKYRTDESYREACKLRSRSTSPQVQRERRNRLKEEVFAHYGNICGCCGETEPLFLTLDHLDNRGAAHRKEICGNSRTGGITAGIFLDIIRRQFPPEFGIRCYNCNCGRARNGGVCPHVKLNTVAPHTDASTDHLPSAPVTPTTAPGLVN